MAVAVRLILATCLLIGAASADPKLIFEENFDHLDQNRWHHLITAWRGGNDEFQYYRNNRKNSFVENGILKIRPTPVSEEMSDNDIRHGQIHDPNCNMEPCASVAGADTVAPVFSARITTQNSFSTKYGRLQVRARLPRGDWIWPAIWMMPKSDHYGGWPRSGEIDIVEGRGNTKLHDAGGANVGVNLMGSTLHWGPDAGANKWFLTHWEKRGPDFSENFHTFELEWNTNHLLFKVDDAEIGRVTPPAGGFWQLGGFGGGSIWGGNKMAPFDQPFYIILNCAVGGRFFDDSFVNQPYHRPWNWNSGHVLKEFYEAQGKWKPTWEKPAMEIDWIKVWAL